MCGLQFVAFTRIRVNWVGEGGGRHGVAHVYVHVHVDKQKQGQKRGITNVDCGWQTARVASLVGCFGFVNPVAQRWRLTQG